MARKRTVWGRALYGRSIIIRALMIGLTLTWSGSEAGASGPDIDLSLGDLTDVLSSGSGMIMMGMKRGRD